MAELTLFTKIINGEIPSHKVYEDELTFAFLDIRPVQPGHVLVVPKNPVEFIWDLPDADYAALMATAKRIALRQREVLAVPYVGVKVVGEEVPHAHVHLIPFREAAAFHGIPNQTDEPDHDTLAAMAQTLAF
jgi:histidine triad (HIT) family protein